MSDCFVTGLRQFQVRNLTVRAAHINSGRLSSRQQSLADATQHDLFLISRGEMDDEESRCVVGDILSKKIKRRQHTRLVCVALWLRGVSQLVSWLSRDSYKIHQVTEDTRSAISLSCSLSYTHISLYHLNIKLTNLHSGIGIKLLLPPSL